MITSYYFQAEFEVRNAGDLEGVLFAIKDWGQTPASVLIHPQPPENIGMVHGLMNVTGDVKNLHEEWRKRVNGVTTVKSFITRWKALSLGTYDHEFTSKMG